MISVMSSGERTTTFGSDRNSHRVEPQASAQQQKVSGEDEKLSSSLENSSSVASGGNEVPKASVPSEGNVVRVSEGSGSEETRVSSEANGFEVFEIKSDDDEGNESLVSVENDSSPERSDDLHKKESHKKANVSDSDYNSMLSMFDEFAANGKGHRVGNGYEVGDMVWGKVKSHPWWPGHVYSEAFASSSVRKMKREGLVLVAFFGDSSYGWFDPAELIPFEPNFAEKSRQTNSKQFVKAVEDAMDELNRRRGLGVICRCRNPYNFRPTDVDGFLAVDVGDNETGIFSENQIKRARDSFVPAGMLGFLHKLALRPMDHEHKNIHFIQSKATVLAFRKAVYAEFDETYAQAFGAQPIQNPPATAPLEPSRVPLSGRLVIAEALGKSKSSGKPSKPKDQPEKDKYLFKRRDDQVEAKTLRVGDGLSGMSSQPLQLEGSGLSVKGLQPGLGGAANSSTLPKAVEVSEEPSSGQPTAGDELQKELVQNKVAEVMATKKPHGEVMKVKAGSVVKKAKPLKRPLGDMDSENVVAEKKIKKRKKDLVGRTTVVPMQAPAADSEAGTFVGKIGEKLPPQLVDPLPRENLHVNRQENDVRRTSLIPNLLEAKTGKDTPIDLPQLLDDLRALALNPFHGAERNCLAITSQVFVNFRSKVFVKSSSGQPSTEDEPTSSVLPSVASSSGKVPQKSKAVPSVKQSKLSVSQEDSSKGGWKRSPSDRLEEVVVKKKKKINDIKLMASEKRGAPKTPEASKVDGKDLSGKVITQQVERKASRKSFEVQRAEGKDIARKPTAATQARASGSELVKKKDPPAKVASPAMLVMKFPPDVSLPSNAELRAKFARFGPMDYSATRIFWKTHTCRVVYRRKSDAQAALNFATSNSSTFFGNMNVRCYIRDMGVDAPEAESAKLQTEDSISGTPQSRDPATVENRLAAGIAAQPLQQTTQLKSCLKRPSNDDGPTAATAGGNGNGDGRGRVKFMLGGEGSSRTIADDAAPSHGLNYHNTDKLPMVVPTPPSSSTLSVPSSQFPFAPTNFPQTEIHPRNGQNQGARGPSNIDISQQMLSLLCRCEGILKTLEGALGYVPYHL